MRRVEAAILSLEHEHGRPPSEGELATALGMALADYQKLLTDARGHQLIYLEDLGDADGDDYLDRHLVGHDLDPLEVLSDKALRQALVGAIEALPEREKLLMALYYEEELNLREIGEVLEVSESRVCQLHSQAIARLRAALSGGVAQVVAATGKRRGRKRRDGAAQGE
jgi:RNA polymerase sigma factor for flagellar operon FliA